ncbi:MAG: class D beta-lactamase [Deltaproteobacteria bacterium]|nr:class D beta-lactamase [Deltaproteobacteria bacterium]
MKPIIVILFLITSTITFAEDFQERPDWKHFFTDQGVDGTIVVVDERVNGHWVYKKDRAQRRYSPASTFKIPHTLFALDAGVVKDEFQVFEWDGKKRQYDSWNKDQTLRSSMRDSTVWVYQQFAIAIGEKEEKEYLEKIRYGSAKFSGPVQDFWLNGSLMISAFEQIVFLQKLYRNDLPFSVEHQRLVKDIMVTEAGKYWLLRAKTGTYVNNNERYGWYVGWVEHPDGAVFFALNIDIVKDHDAPKRIDISKTVLRSIKALE